MEGGSEFDLKAIDADNETNKNLNTGSEKWPNKRWHIHYIPLFACAILFEIWNFLFFCNFC